MWFEKNWFTPKEVGELLGMTGRHVTNLIKKGKIKADKDEDGRYCIDKATFFQMFPETMMPEKQRSTENKSEENSAKVLQEKISSLEEIIKEKKKLNEVLMEQLDYSMKEKSKMLDAINSHARLLEHKESIKKTETKTKSRGRANWLKWFTRKE